MAILNLLADFGVNDVTSFQIGVVTAGVAIILVLLIVFVISRLFVSQPKKKRIS